jgi:hypothetical protein
MLCHRLVVGSVGASATAVDVATGAAVMATTTMPSTLSSLRPQPRTKTRTSASQWRSSAAPTALPLGESVAFERCSHCAAAIALCATAALWLRR